MMNISFRDYRKNDIHGVSLYPATMIAPVQNKIMERLFSSDEIKTVYDPYHGSGTALYEAAKLDNECEIIGCDINPLANLITYIKLKGVTNNIKKDIELLFSLINEAPQYTFEFNNIDKWFRKDIIESLKKVKWAIGKIKSKRNRSFFWVVLSNVIRRYSNTRSSTYKLHVKQESDILKFKNNLVSDFKKQVLRDAPKFNLKIRDVTLLKGDVLKLGQKIPDNSVDLTITSPPYGDNQTTVTYGQFSTLALFWIDKRDLNLEGWELDNYSSIDRMSLGGRRKNSISKLGEELLEPYLRKISERKQDKVISFFADYFLSLDDICRVTNKYIVMTLGNRTVDRVNINLTKITSLYLEAKNFVKLNLLSREIPMKRIPRVTSSVNNESVPSMTKEFVLIYCKRS